ncbi:unnamed protein product [Clonostachys rhizophaga]|uniref:Uncharacterized protein n=1 Tax=Clonostachys rhizophaga TaxID=160324 RepID=A0A9N9YP33_9HYPO|nr:unnamed protein product [Clonostachys rhizophaga]
MSFPGLTVEHQLVDSAAVIMVKNLNGRRRHKQPAQETSPATRASTEEAKTVDVGDEMAKQPTSILKA